MKKVLLLLMTVLLLFTAACSVIKPVYGPGNYPTDDAYHPETDDAYYLTGNAVAVAAVAQTENGYYFLIGDTLLYADADTMKPIPVCAKPNCLHDEETDREKRDACNAYFLRSLAAGNVFYVHDQLYVFHGLSARTSRLGTFALTALSADGTVRTPVLEIEAEFPLMTLIHRGRFYIATQTTDESGASTAELWSYSLDKPDKEPVLLYRTEALQRSGNIISDTYAYGNRLYLREYLGGDAGDQEMGLRICDLTTGEWTVLDNPEGYTMGPNGICDGRLMCAYAQLNASAIYHASEERPDLSAPMISYALDGSDPQEIAFDTWGRLTADESYIYMRSPRYVQQQADGSYTYSTATDSLYFYDSEMNLVDELSNELLAYEDAKIVSVTQFPTYGEHLLIHVRYRDQNALYYIDRDRIGSGEITPVEFHRYDAYAYSFADRDD